MSHFNKRTFAGIRCLFDANQELDFKAYDTWGNPNVYNSLCLCQSFFPFLNNLIFCTT